MKKISRNKNIILIILILFGISIGYAFLNKTLEIKGNSEVKKTTWDIHFENVIVKEGSVEPIKKPTIDNTRHSVDFSKTVGVTAFSNNRIHGTTNSEYVGSIVYNYIYDYEEYLAENYKGLNIYEVRLISVNELTSSKIGCSTTELSCSDAPSFIYSTSYWTCTSYGNDYIWAVYSIAGFDMAYYSIETDLGVRPLVSLYKDSFE